MAEALKAGDGKAIEGRLPQKSELEKFVKDTERYAKNAAEHSGYGSNATKLFCKKFNLEPGAVSIFRRFTKMDRAKGATQWAQLSELMRIQGLDEVKTLFDQGEPDEAETNAAEALEPPPPGDDDPFADPITKQAKTNVVRLQQGIKQLPPEDDPAPKGPKGGKRGPKPKKAA
jgi:hypothetical protein